MRTVDGIELRGSLYAGDQDPGRGAVIVVNGGAGIPSTFYARFAEAAAGRGIPAITYDYRGIGQSRPAGSLKGFSASVEDWGSKDCAAFLLAARARFPDAQVAVLGHSVGAFLTGFVRPSGLVSRFVTVAGHTGFWGDYALPARIPMTLLWHALMPAITRIIGYFPGRRLGLPDDLPLQVAMEWARRLRPDFTWNLRAPDGRRDDRRAGALLEGFSGFRAPALALRIADDPFSTRQATRRLQRLFGNCTWEESEVLPPTPGKLGHFGYFRARNHGLWDDVFRWLLGGTSGRDGIIAPGAP